MLITGVLDHALAGLLFALFLPPLPEPLPPELESTEPLLPLLLANLASLLCRQAEPERLKDLPVSFFSTSDSTTTAGLLPTAGRAVDLRMRLLGFLGACGAPGAGEGTRGLGSGDGLGPPPWDWGRGFHDEWRRRVAEEESPGKGCVNC